MRTAAYQRGGRPLLLAGALIALTALLANCGQTITDSLTPAQMQVSIDVKDYHQGTAPIAIRFADLQDNTIEFVHGETVTCDGTYLKYDSAFIARWIGYGSYVGDVQRHAPGESYGFKYTAAQGASETIAVPVVDAPITITNIASDGTVGIPTAGSSFIITYGVSGLANTILYATATDSRSHTALALAFNDSGSISFKGADFSQFAPGPGLITVSRVTTTSISGTPFSKVTASYENIVTLPVMWQ
ncbi:MAG: hypothetical protein C5B60_01825 [Chloroflexi bacterium]|nr:MAG: hypothetical protein C5B60_01825 [Chloroflexota bacterium]